MPHPAAALLAADLGHLPHTNAQGEQGIVHIPGFISTAGMGEEQAADAGILAQTLAEAIIEDLAKHGYHVIHKAELKARATALAAEQHAGDLTTREIVLHCSRCRRPVVKVNTAGQAKVHVASMAAGLQAHQQVCK